MTDIYDDARLEFVNSETGEIYSFTFEEAANLIEENPYCELAGVIYQMTSPTVTPDELKSFLREKCDSVGDSDEGDSDDDGQSNNHLH